MKFAPQALLRLCNQQSPSQLFRAVTVKAVKSYSRYAARARMEKIEG